MARVALEKKRRFEELSEEEKTAEISKAIDEISVSGYKGTWVDTREHVKYTIGNIIKVKAV